MDSSDPLLEQLSSSNENERKHKRIGTQETLDASYEPLLPPSTSGSRTFSHSKEQDSSSKVYCGGRLSRKGCRCLVYALVSVLLLVLVLSLLTWFVFLPKYVQSQLEQATLSIHSVHMFGLRNDGFLLKMNYTIQDLPSSLTADIEEMDATVKYNNTVIGSMRLPGIHVEKGMSSLHLMSETEFFITDEAFWIATVKDMIQKKKITWDLESQVNMRVDVVGGISFRGISFHKSVVLAGMEGLPNVEILDMDLPENLQWKPDGSIDPKSTIQGIKVDSKARIFNPSNTTIEMGDLMLALRYDPSDDPHPVERGYTLGLLVANNFTLIPGENVLSLKGALVNPESMDLNGGKEVDEIRNVFGTFFTRYLQSPQKIGIVGFGARDEFVSRKAWPSPNPSPLPPLIVKWLDTSVSAIQNVITLQHDKEKGSIDIKEVQLKKIKLKILDPARVECRPVVSATLHAVVSVPFGFQLEMKKMKQSIRMYRCLLGDKCGFSDDEKVGFLESSWDDASSRIDNFGQELLLQNSDDQHITSARRYSVEAFLNNSTDSRGDERVSLIVDHVMNYKLLMKEVISSKKVQLGIAGQASGRIACGLGGLIEISGLNFEESVWIDGLDGFRSEAGDLLAITQNLNVQDIGSNGTLKFRMGGAFMKMQTEQVALELEPELAFSMFYDPTHSNDESNSIQMGTVYLKSLNLGDDICTNALHYPLRNQTQISQSRYCPINPEGVFRFPEKELEAEVCEDRSKCAGRSFLTEYLRGGIQQPVRVFLKFLYGPPDFSEARDVMILRNITIPGYTPAKFDVRRAPYQLLRRIIAKPAGVNVLDGKLWCWLEFYNPLQVPLRYYYVNVDTFVDGKMIGNVHINFTNYDPFILKPNYVPPSEPPVRPGVDRKNDPYGPHPREKCIEKGDCQIAPFDIEPAGKGGPKCFSGYSTKTKTTRRLEVGYTLATPGLRAFWKALWNKKDDTKMNVTIVGQVAIGIGAIPYKGPARNDSRPVPLTPGAKERAFRDPFIYPDNPSNEPVIVTWLDYKQEETEMWFRKLSRNDTIPWEPPFYPPDCEQ